ncbi:TRAP transporter substrate-binding protein [Saccharophagus degradans]|uniref:TRAP dicarboxylate transporter, DctP subunit n=1 Tax=Saccharophagus degradans (strain 2-40 / ATCC 43961 / DSM 17024) TaxID=203122 RepID=Q21L99_SACD2|nr:TRAP transporter substrate-binding protein [Saccharophagus degradans]ABD80530.1 TRAP dicarboxylate transporter, DctP subunit [Saccharophagus degradans 2-40]WGO97277.1 TRAP transporter substrate-binding protein [Saccharophagus degradans]
MPFFKTTRLLLTAITTLAFTACAIDEDTTTLRVAHTLDTHHPVHKAMQYMDERLSLHSGGKMRLALYPSGQLGSEREVIELLQIGSLSMTKVSASSIEAFVPEMKVFGLPYLFNDSTHFWNVLNGEIGEQLLESGVPFRIRGLGYFDAGSRSFYSTNKQIITPDDLPGMKIRVLSSPSAIAMVKAMGGSATPISWSELYTSLQQGVVDGAENNLPSFYLSKHYEVCKYLILDEHTAIPDVLIIGTHTWDNLSPQQQQWLSLAMKEATVYQRTLWEQASAEALAAVKAAGVTVIPAQKELFQQSVQALIEAQTKTELGPIIKKIRDTE